MAAIGTPTMTTLAIVERILPIHSASTATASCEVSATTRKICTAAHMMAASRKTVRAATSPRAVALQGMADGSLSPACDVRTPAVPW